MNEQLIKSALRANQMSLAFHWLYDRDYLKALSKKEQLFGQKPLKKHYLQAKNSYFAYDKHSAYTCQGEILRALFIAVQKKRDFSASDYQELLLAMFKPGGTYQGYTETYAKTLVFNDLAKSYKKEELPLNDDQLVGFLPYLVFRWLKSNEVEFNLLEKALSFQAVLSNNPSYQGYFLMLDNLLDGTRGKDLNTGLEESIAFAPKSAQNNLRQALAMEDSEYFIKHYSGTACNFEDAISLIYHIMAHQKTELEALEYNLILGGASADRAILIGFIYTFFGIYNEEPDG